jgi:hypothetical protein
MTQSREQEDKVPPERKRPTPPDPTRQTKRQADDNQDDMGRDINRPDRVANEINKTGH